ncbi:uncharacterized protein [Euwallacea similis]|uniref:uncharacterized protein n=1 Tax=Euwallacea similis TaxID=1736056 RepID=UPI00344F57C1
MSGKSGNTVRIYVLKVSVGIPKLLFYEKQHGTKQNKRRKKRTQKLDPGTDRQIVKFSRRNPIVTAVDIQKNIFPKKCENKSSVLSVRVIRRRPNEANLYGRVNLRRTIRHEPCPSGNKFFGPMKQKSIV